MYMRGRALERKVDKGESCVDVRKVTEDATRWAHPQRRW